MDNLVHNRKFGPKMENFDKNGSFCPKAKIWSKIEIFIKNPNFCQKLK